MSRLYAVESAPSQHRREGRSPRGRARRRTSRRSRAPLAAAVGVPGAPPAAAPAAAQTTAGRGRARPAGAHGARSIVVAGDEQPAGGARALRTPSTGARQRRRHRALHRSGGGRARSSQLQSLRELVADMQRRHGGRAADPRRQPGLRRAGRPPLRRRAREGGVHAPTSGLYDDETSALCQWHVPEAHSLEAWGDARACDGTVTIMQPLIAPLYGGKSAHDVLIGLSQTPGPLGATTSCATPGGRPQPAQARSTSRRSGARRCTTASWPARAFPPKAVAAGDVFAAIGAAAPAAAGPRARRSAPTRRSTTGASRTTAGCRSCRSRSPS